MLFLMLTGFVFAIVMAFDMFTLFKYDIIDKTTDIISNLFVLLFRKKKKDITNPKAICVEDLIPGNIYIAQESTKKP